MRLIKRSYKLINNFTQILNDIIENRQLSFKALGFYVFLLSKINNWQIWLHDIAKNGPDRIRSLRAAINELEKAGLVIRRKDKNKNGHFDYTLEILISPKAPNVENNEEKPRTQNHVMESPEVDGPSVEKETHNNTNKNNIIRDNNIKINKGFDFDVKFTNKLIDLILIPAGRKRPNAAQLDQWILEVRAMREEDGHSETYLEHVLDVIIKDKFWLPFIRDTSYFRQKLNSGKFYIVLNRSSILAQKKLVPKVSLDDPLPPDFIEWIKTSAPALQECNNCRTGRDIYWAREAVRIGEANEVMIQAVTEAEKRGLLRDGGAQ